MGGCSYSSVFLNFNIGIWEDTFRVEDEVTFCTVFLTFIYTFTLQYCGSQPASSRKNHNQSDYNRYLLYLFFVSIIFGLLFGFLLLLL